jgi:hypothetical protein
VKAELADNLSDYHVERVAILGFANTTGDPKADDMARYVTQALYEEDTYRWVISSTFAQDAERAKVQSEHERMLSTWQKKHTMDAPVVRKVLEATQHDAVVAMVISKWEQVKIDPTQEGTSDTSVGLSMKMFAADGTLLWSASDLKTEHSPAYLPSFNTKSTVGGRAVTTSAGAVPDPPPIEKVAMDVARDVISTLPAVKRPGDES